MNKLFESMYKNSPGIVQDLCITAFDLIYLRRRSGEYRTIKELNQKLYVADRNELKQIQKKKMVAFLKFVRENSRFYRKLWGNINIEKIRNVEDLKMLPIVTKEEIRKKIDLVKTVEKGYCKGNTGGTTGKSLTVFYTWSDIQERMAILDAFRERLGWKLGKRTAWFSGKNLLTERDVRNRRYWKTDVLFKIRYYSTFHITSETIPYYLENLIKYQPEFFSGFPSNILELAYFIKRNEIKLDLKLKGIITTAETLLQTHQEIIEEAFQAKVYDYYASSEGAPFIIQCQYGVRHFLPQTGVIEIIDEKGLPSTHGEMVVTSFTTHGTPLVRYKIGDLLEFEKCTGKSCLCGSNAPVVKRIEGRSNDYIYSKERGKINLGNVSNCVKYAHGVVKFQVTQNTFEEVNVRMVVDNKMYTCNDELSIKMEFEERLGKGLTVNFEYVDDIPCETSGKYRFVKNDIPKEMLESGRCRENDSSEK